MTERIYPINVKYSFQRAIYIKYDNKSTYKNLSKEDKENIRDRIFQYLKSDIDKLHDGLFLDENDRDRFSFEILDDIEIQ